MAAPGQATKLSEDAITAQADAVTTRTALSQASTQEAAGRVFPVARSAEEAPIPEGEVSPLIQRNRAVATQLLAAIEARRVVFYKGVDKREIGVIQAVASFGCYTYSRPKEAPKVVKHTCWSAETLDVLEALLGSSLGSRPGGFKLLSTMREPTPRKGSGRFPNHGRILDDSEVLIDYQGRRVNGMSTALDIAGFSGSDINLQQLGAKSGTVFARKKADSMAGVAAVLASLPGSSALRYSVGLPRPVDADAKRTGDDDVTVFIPVSPVAATPEAPPLRKGGSLVPRTSPTGTFRGDLQYVYPEARKILTSALASNMARPNLVALYADGGDHLHLTIYRPGDKP